MITTTKREDDQDAIEEKEIQNDGEEEEDGNMQ